ncbi:hypothetical protein MATL_G00232440 [Megalops atlanticus]|uniref:Uncharacterized protein n=1 Tax=Megalops atlanticus TaxID=7932 RepID=A0A9D3PDQ0_MEGAT|nr:hypothetical protein MATL_G00232440 [Megalops atlanticus]
MMNTNQICIDSFLSNEDDVRAIEAAIKTAVKAVMYVLCNINANRVREYKMLLSQKDKENERLRMQVDSAEKELMSLRRYKHSVEHGRDVHVTCGHDSGFSSEENSKHSVCTKPGLPDGDEDMHSETVWNRDFTSACTRVSDGVEHQQRAKATDTSLIKVNEDFHSQGSRQRAASCTLKPSGDVRQSAVFPVKEEPSDFETVCVKLELCDQTVGELDGTHPGLPTNTEITWPRVGAGSVVPNHSFGMSVQPEERTMLSAACQKSRLSNKDRLLLYRARIRADPEKYQAYREMDRRRYQMRKKSIKDLPEHCQKLKREAWREASRRHRARKKSCLQTGPHIGQ